MIWYLNKRAVLLPPKMGSLQFGGYLKSGKCLFGNMVWLKFLCRHFFGGLNKKIFPNTMCYFCQVGHWESWIWYALILGLFADSRCNNQPLCVLVLTIFSCSSAWWINTYFSYQLTAYMLSMLIYTTRTLLVEAWSR